MEFIPGGSLFPLYSRIGFSVTFLALLGAGLISTALLVQEMAVLQPIEIFIPYIYIPGYILIVLGLLASVNVFIQWWTFIQEDKDFIKLCIRTMSCIFFATFIAGSIAMVIFCNSTSDKCEKKMRFAMTNYGKNKNLAARMDAIQSSLKCCGIESYLDWDMNGDYKGAFSNPRKCSVPTSCNINGMSGTAIFSCGLKELNIPINYTMFIRRLIFGDVEDIIWGPEILHKEGCLKKSVEKLDESAFLVFTYTFLLMVTEVLTMFMATVLTTFLEKRILEIAIAFIPDDLDNNINEHAIIEVPDYIPIPHPKED